MPTSEPIEVALRRFREQGGVLRTSQALRLGIHPRTLYVLRDRGLVDRLHRGLYRLAEMPPPSNADLVTVALRVPQAVFCLISALAFHELTTQVPHVVHIALPRGAERPRVRHPPVQVYWFSGAAWTDGVSTVLVDAVPIRVYNPEKSVADSFRYRHKLGLDVALEALKLYRERADFDVNRLLHYARICRVEGVMRPYLEALA